MLHDWLPPLVEALDSDPSLAGVAPLLIYPDNTVQHLGASNTPEGNYVTHLYQSLPITNPLTRNRKKFKIIITACLLLHKKEFFDARGFHHKYINRFEDVELCLKLTHNNRYMMCIPEIIVIHKESQTPSKKDKDKDNTFLFNKRNNISLLGNMDYLLEQNGYALSITPCLFPYPTIHKKNMNFKKVSPILLIHCSVLTFLKRNLFGNKVDIF